MPIMYPRLRIDITWAELARTAWECGRRPGRLDSRQQVFESSLAVRSDFDRLLTALNLPAGSEVLFSEITVPHMARIVREHALVPVGVPVDPRTLSVSLADVEARLTPHTRLLVAAHLFGSRMPLDELGQLCRERRIVLVEDCAQALTNGEVVRHALADVSLYSFGPIKTATALGGSVAVVRDSDLRQRMAAIANQWPEQSRAEYFFRVAKIAALKLLSQPVLFTGLVRAISMFGGDADAFVGHSARGFPDEQLFGYLRQRPCPALQQLVARRLATFDTEAIAARTRRGKQLAQTVAPPDFVAGCDNPTHTYWVFPLVCEQPESVVRSLRAAGFDASQISGLTVLGDDSPDHWFRRTVFVPHGQQAPLRNLSLALASLDELGVRASDSH